MALSACKVPSNSGLRDDLRALKSRTQTFELMAVTYVDEDGNGGDGKFYEKAIAIDTEVRKHLQHAVKLYDELNQAIGESV